MRGSMFKGDNMQMYEQESTLESTTLMDACAIIGGAAVSIYESVLGICCRKTFKNIFSQISKFFLIRCIKQLHTFHHRRSFSVILFDKFIAFFIKWGAFK